MEGILVILLCCFLDDLVTIRHSDKTNHGALVTTLGNETENSITQSWGKTCVGLN